jgi:hypothetical protein
VNAERTLEEPSAYELLERVKRAYSGPRQNFMLSQRLLRTGLDLDAITEADRDATKAKLLRAAIEEICPRVDTTPSKAR